MRSAVRSRIVLGLITILAPCISGAETGSPVLFMLEKKFDFQAAGVGLIGAVTSDVIAKRTSKDAERVTSALSFDLAPAAMNGIACTGDEACKATLIEIADETTLRKQLDGAGGGSLTVLQY